MATLTLQDVQGRVGGTPLLWSNGMGVNSAAVMVLLAEWGFSPTLAQFADVGGGEWPETYEYIPITERFMAQHGLGDLRIVRRKSRHESLEANCLANDTLPGMAFGRKSCSMAWKVEPMEKDASLCDAVIEARRNGLKPIRIIGYDYGEADSKRFAHVAGREDTELDFWYPLRDAKLDRDACKRVIVNAGLPVPPKSACTFCPAMKFEEVRQLVTLHPHLAERAFRMEVNAAQGKHGLGTTAGLGRRFSWLRRMASVSPSIASQYEVELQILDGHAGRRYRTGTA